MCQPTESVQVSIWNAIDYSSQSSAHKICVKRFWDYEEAKAYYDKVSSSYAKKITSATNSELQYSEGWSKYIPGKTFYKDYWVSYYLQTTDDDSGEYYIGWTVYFNDQKSAEEYYGSLDKEDKKLVCKGEILDKKGSEENVLRIY